MVLMLVLVLVLVLVMLMLLSSRYTFADLSQPIVKDIFSLKVNVAATSESLSWLAFDAALFFILTCRE